MADSQSSDGELAGSTRGADLLPYETGSSAVMAFLARHGSPVENTTLISIAVRQRALDELDWCPDDLSLNDVHDYVTGTLLPEMAQDGRIECYQTGGVVEPTGGFEDDSILSE